MPPRRRIQKPKIRKILISARRRERGPQSRMDAYSRVIWKRSARVRSQLKYGWKFLESFTDSIIVNRGHPVMSIRAEMEEGIFESPIVIKLTNGLSDVGTISLGFKPNEVVVEAIQGMKGKKKLMNQTHRELGEPWANVLLRVIESHAKKAGYSVVRIRKAETLYHYRLPSFTGRDEREVITRRIQEQMHHFYSHVAKGAGYEEGKRYYVKHLKEKN